MPAASAYTLLHCNQNQPGGAGDGDAGTAFLRLKPAPILDDGYCAEHADEFWRAEMSQESAVGAARVDRVKSLRNFSKPPTATA